jgi:ATP-dependent Clp protease, protease subunit
MKGLIGLSFGIIVLVVTLGLLKSGELPVIKENVRASEKFAEESRPFKEETTKVHDLDISKGNVVLLFDEVTTETVNAAIESIRKFNQTSTKPIYLLLDSPGGSVIDGARLISTIQASKLPVNTVCLQICASMAAMILEYGNERYAVDRSIIMFHPASIQAMVAGELDKVVSRFQFLQRYVNKMDRHVARRSKMTYEAFKAKSNQELWIDAEDALADNLIDKVVRVELTSKDMSKFGQNKIREIYLGNL